MNVLHEPLDIILEHPCLRIWQERKDIIYAGPIIVNANIYRIKVREYRSINTSRFEFSDVDNSLEQFTGILENIRDIDARNISSYMKNLVKIIETYNPPLKNYSSICRKILSEYKEFSEFYIDLKMLELTPNLSTIKVSFTDQDNREHNVEFGVDYDEASNIFYFQKYDVPIDNNILKMKSSNLKELYNIYLGYIGNLQPFFEFMDMVDVQCVVIEPKVLSRKHIYRRVLMDENFSVIITVDPLNMNSCPSFAFVGPNNLIDEYQRRVQNNINHWDYKGNCFEQVLLVLGIEHFSKKLDNISISESQNNILKADTDCSICFSSEIEGHFPDIACDNQCCGNIYHQACLYEWLSSVESRRNFNEVEGSCPNCDKSITCPIVGIHVTRL